ncbi:MAG: NAD-dependent dehydratase [Gallionellales bacterium RIFCSPLOWO2_02_60_31]|nr:MAG: NAD-dependent dehydratase [Gallionellales bacterium RIFCSPLOWO2_02_60_31]
MRFLITGASGFVGRSLCIEAVRRGLCVRGAVRSPHPLPAGVEPAIAGPIDGKTDWTDVLKDVDVVIHLAARVHVMHETAGDPLAEFLEVNLHGTANLARQAAQAGVKRLVYVSSIKVNGESTEAHPFSESDNPNPQDPYAVSKWQAEQALQQIAQETGLEAVIVRPPLIYGPGVKGNFISLLAAVDKGIPLPLASVRNKRSLIYLGNLADALIVCASHPAAAGKTYLVRDGEDVSMPELVRQMAISLEKPARLFPLPVGLLRGLGSLFGKLASVERVVGSLRVNDDLIRKELGWKPRFTLQQGLQATALWYSKINKAPD